MHSHLAPELGQKLPFQLPVIQHPEVSIVIPLVKILCNKSMVAQAQLLSPKIICVQVTVSLCWGKSLHHHITDHTETDFQVQRCRFIVCNYQSIYWKLENLNNSYTLYTHRATVLENKGSELKKRCSTPSILRFSCNRDSFPTFHLLHHFIQMQSQYFTH